MKGTDDVTHDDRAVSFNGYVLTRQPLGLRRNGQPVDMPRQSLELLGYLIGRRDRVATRQELIERFWSLDQVGVDQNLNTCVRRLRRTLEESGDAAHLIETHPRVGYRFVGEVDPAPAASITGKRRRPVWGSPAAALVVCLIGLALVPWSMSGAGAGKAVSRNATAVIAMPPGRNMCEKALFPMFLEGLQENLLAEIYRLARADVSLLRVDSREAADVHPTAQYYLDLGVRQMPDRTIANLSLVSTATGEIVWTTQIDEPTDIGNYLSTQETLAARLARVFVKQGSYK